ncbi:spore gernimation protein GerQ [Paenibacillus crassostreae]|uniref:Spore gernimation protein GerQ n=2 Tax=Paenibacillus crassostreae TaxID=1763538 RepID=A0A167AQV0_9BACL|nr:spore coat protein [Paenibacillus crassostreae]OAB71328.1 spore gernimation protein GerQ [Paenibacillus crassostreae]
MQNQQMNQNQNQNMNRGGHELLDMHELLSCTIGILDQMVMFKPMVQDQEFLSIMDRQYNFISSQYNLTVECFTTGSKPSQDTSKYMMKESANQIKYGLTSSQPDKPIQSSNQMKEAQISGLLVGALKSAATHMTMTANEVTNPVLRRVVASQVENYIEMAYEVFLYQNKHGYYQVAQLDNSDGQQMLHAYAPTTGQPQIPIQ